MGVYIGRGGNIAVSQPFLDILQRHAVGVQHAGTGVPQVVEADMPEALAIQKRLKLSRQRIGRDQFSELIDVDIRLIFLVVALDHRKKRISPTEVLP